ncbi:phosphocholine cytidylyltransferase family protein [Castellaniella caeni]|uniref:phosphocholine cytidylyltransferase family protein n=1 Tax=Castellaniella caeni TaxID=266123 RepID=UPI000830F063|nr:phosphocholine cytidylyltransferase family protein [Castellaniella caeni]
MQTKAIILAAGRGSRMGTMTDEQPKCFVKLHGHRLLDWQLMALRAAGIRDIAIVRGYCGHLFTEEVHYFENQRWQQTNMIRSLESAAQWLAEGNCIVSYSDIFYSADTVRRLAASSELIALSYDPDWLAVWGRRFANPLLDAETFRRGADGLLLEIGQRSQSADTIEGQYMGLLRLTPGGWYDMVALLKQLSPVEVDRLDMTSLLSRGLTAGWRIQTVPVSGAWGEVDSSSDLAAYSEVSFDDIGH